MIKNLLFDLGGVIMDLDRNRCVEAFRALGMANPDELLGVYGQKGIFLALERGDVTAAEFRDAVRPMFATEVTDEQIDTAFNQFLIGIPPHRLQQLRDLRTRYSVNLLSNTNPIMMESRIADEFRQEGREMADYFDAIVASYIARCYKPEPEIFDYAASHCRIDPAETLFFDDSQANVDAARACGYQAVLVPEGTEFMDILNDYLSRQ